MSYKNLDFRTKSYEFLIFHRDVVRKMNENSIELDAFEHPNIEQEDMELCLHRLRQQGYTLKLEIIEVMTFVKGPITVSVFKNAIAFHVPHGVIGDLITVASDDAYALTGKGILDMYDSQEKAWTIW
jgi:hypothetical protein